MNDVLKYFYEPILKVFDYRGRATRTQYWVGFGLTGVYYFALSQVFWSFYTGYVDFMYQNMGNAFTRVALSIGQILLLVIFWVLPAAPIVALTKRRNIDAAAKPWVFGWFATGILLCIPSAIWGLATFWFLSLPGLLLAAVFGVACMIVGLLPSAENLVLKNAKAPLGERLKSELAERAQELADE